MTFAADISKFVAKCEANNQAVFVGSAVEAKNSIQYGSPLTGAPGQPVGDPATDPDSGNLLASWQLEFPTPSEALISTNVIYAPENEYGVREDGRPYVQRSAVGGRHSLALTIAGFQNIVNDQAAKVQGYANSESGFANEEGG